MANPPPVDRRKVFVRIADELRQDISAGRYPVGEAFPSIGELVDRFGSAKATIERSLEVLRDEGLLASRQGSRTVVVAVPDAPAIPDAPDRAGAPAESSEEFQVLYGYLQEIRSNMNRLSAKLEELDERTKDL
jgi:DNA-binding FadR family transcriptional regulator